LDVVGMSGDVARFYKDRAKTFKTDEKRFDYDEDGNMVERTKNDDGQYVVSKTIALPSYRPLHYEERDTMERDRQTAIAEATRVFETARRALYDASRASDTDDKLIKKLNSTVEDAEYALHQTRFPLYGARREWGVQIRKLDPSKSDQRMIPYPVLVAAAFPFPLQDYYVREGEAVAPLQSVAEIKQQQQPVILFSTPDANENGYLSLEWAVDLEINGTMYHSATQAVYAEMAKVLGDKEGLRKIMLTDSPLSIHYEATGSEAVWKENIARLLYEVNLHKFTRYPDLQAMLRKTGTAVLGAYFPNDVLLGIGLSLDREESKQTRHWTGANLLGKALMEVRRVLQEPKVSLQRSRAKPSVAAVAEPVASVAAVPEPVAAVPEPVAAVPEPVAAVPEPVAARRLISRPKRVVNAIPSAPASSVPAAAIAVPAAAVPTEAIAAPSAPAAASSARRTIRRPGTIAAVPSASVPSAAVPSAAVPSAAVPSASASSGSKGTL
jgi:ribA/ribD-fused uncharacterized protein